MTADGQAPPPPPAPPPSGGSPDPGGHPGHGSQQNQGKPQPDSPGQGPKLDDESAAGGAKGTDTSADEKINADAWAAAFRPGAASANRRHRREAQDSVNGDKVNGDKYVYNLMGERQAVLRRLPPSTEAQACGPAFVFPEGWDAVRIQFVPLRTSILMASPGEGRTATAVRLMKAAGVETIYLLDRNVDLGRVVEIIDRGHGGIEERAAFVVCEPADLGKLHGGVFQALEYALEKADARLVLITGRDAPLTDADLLASRVELPTAPDRRLILTSHLRTYLDEYTADGLLRDEAVAKLVTELLGAQASCDMAARLALLLSREPYGEVNTDRVRAQMVRRQADEFDIWFDSLPGTMIRSHAIALAVLDGHPYEDVAFAARTLAEQLEPTRELIAADDGVALRTVTPDRFRWSRTRWMELLRASVAPESISQNGFPSTVEVIRYRESDRAANILERVWREYPVHDDLLKWLETLVGYGGDRVISFAGTVLGKFAVLSYDWVFPTIARWAENDAYNLRLAAAVAVTAATADDATRTRVRGAVAAWQADEDDPLRQATVARVHGMSTGPVDTAAALRSLGQLMRIRVEDLTTHERVSLIFAIGEGLADLVAGAPTTVLPAVYASLRRWFSDRERSNNAQSAFLVVAAALLADSDVGAPATASRWPALLFLTQVDEQFRQPLVVLWRGVIHLGAYEVLVENVLTGWAAVAEEDPALRDLFARVIRAIVGGDQPSFRFIVRLVDRWDDEDTLQPLPNTARAVNAALGR